MLMTLDQSSSVTGWALGSVGERPRFGTFKLPKTGDEFGPMLALFGGWLRGMITDNAVTLVGFEQPIFPIARVKWVFSRIEHRNVPRAFIQTQVGILRKLYSLAGEVERVCYDMQIPVVEENVQTWRAGFLVRNDEGAKKLDKASVTPRCRALGYEPKNSDEADAIGLWLFIESQLKEEKDL